MKASNNQEQMAFRAFEGIMLDIQRIWDLANTVAYSNDSYREAIRNLALIAESYCMERLYDGINSENWDVLSEYINRFFDVKVQEELKYEYLPYWMFEQAIKQIIPEVMIRVEDYNGNLVTFNDLVTLYDIMTNGITYRSVDAITTEPRNNLPTIESTKQYVLKDSTKFY